jgi:tetratricopeptide (TPR) repeat protein/DNA-binding CsgD family transcriptional regulator
MLRPAYMILLCLFLLSAAMPLRAQNNSLSACQWARRLADPSDKENKTVTELYAVLNKLDSAHTFAFLREMKDNAKGNYFTARFDCVQAEMIHDKHLASSEGVIAFKKEPVKSQIIKLLGQAKQISYETGDDHLAAYVSGVYGRYMSAFGETEAAVMYMMNCADLYEKVHLSADCKIYVVLGEMLWKVREYEKCIRYTRKAVSLLPTLPEKELSDYTIFCTNTLGLAFHRMGQYDSAFFYYREGYAFAEKEHNVAWTGIFSGNMAQIYFAQGQFARALPLFALDHHTSDSLGYFDNAANSLQWAARANLALGNTGLALQQVKKAFGLLQKWPNSNYLQNAYYTATEIFKTLKNEDSSFYYSGLYNKLHDSLEKVIYQSSVSISKLRLDDEKSRYDILDLQRDKQAQVEQRDLLIAGIIFFAVIALFGINRKRLQLKYRQNLLEQEMGAAKTQLDMFTRNIVEKTGLIEKLEEQVKASSSSADEQRLVAELLSQTILTEDDWLRFKSLFERTHPLFFTKLKAQISDITVAEQRMAALTRLDLTTKQMAAMLGISPNSVIKAKQRLRQRLDLQTDPQVEGFLAQL